MNLKSPAVQEGDIYELLLVDGRLFEIRYGYYEEYERNGAEPIPIFPDLGEVPVYGSSGKRIVTFMQEPCPHFKPQSDDTELCCGCCRFYPKNRQMMDVCACERNNAVQTPERSNIV